MPNYSNLMKSRGTIIEMLNDRGYKLTNYLIEITLDEIKESYTKNKINLSTQDGKINTIFWDEPLNISKINNHITKLKKDNLNLVLVILGRNNVDDEITISQKRNLDSIFGKINYEIFYIDELVFNITKHHYVPTHILLNEKESEIIYNSYGKNLPLIDKSDIIVRYYGGKIGNIFKIIRPNNLYYRKVENIN
jgi:DNA-directed RNA polymerase subunit H (RpoH/RPB5)